ncbi:MAG: sugar transferase [Candidatus Hydrogenedentes bacterium]|nr:sugar transferase [Candidatus Hydrogenedentota bacterium]
MSRQENMVTSGPPIEAAARGQNGAGAAKGFREVSQVSLASVDFLLCSGIIALALQVRFWGDVPVQHKLPYLLTFPGLVAWQVFAAKFFGLYDFRHKLMAVDHVFGALGAAVFGVAPGYMFLVLFSLYYAPWFELSRLVTLLVFVLTAAWFAASRIALLAWLRLRGHEVRVVLVGRLEKCRQLAGDIVAHAPRLVKLAGIAPMEQAAAGGDIIGHTGELNQLVRRERIDELVLVGADVPQHQLRGLLTECEQSRAEVFIYPDLDLAILAHTKVTNIAGLPLIPLEPFFATSPYRFVKRLTDVVAASFLLVVTLPLAALAALAIKLDSSGPVLFSQPRVGLNGREFRVYKFRTMIVNAEAGSGPVLATRQDPRVTRAGRILRRWRIDEIPQFWNVLRGDMSLVGPRPERREFVDEFVKETPLYDRRFLVRPGMTGLAQVNGRYDTDYTHKIRYDLIYINSLSLATDLRILVLTVRAILAG